MKEEINLKITSHVEQCPCGRLCTAFICGGEYVEPPRCSYHRGWDGYDVHWESRYKQFWYDEGLNWQPIPERFKNVKIGNPLI